MVDNHYQPILGFLRARGATAELAEDLAQETFLKGFQKLPQRQTGCSFSAWLYSIARHLLIDEFRRRSRETDIVGGLPPTTAGEGSPEEAAVSRNQIETYLKSLPDHEKILVEMRVFQELSFASIAEFFDEKEGTVRVRFCRIMNRFSQMESGTEER